MWKTDAIELIDGPLPASTIAYTPLTVTDVITESYHEGKRWYSYNGELYPSITTLISATDIEGQTALTEWRSKIGSGAAAAITKKAADRGVQWHAFCEKFVMGETAHWSSFTEPGDQRYAANIGRVLNDRVASVLASETRVFSPSLGVAGRMDLAVKLHDGRRAILDFKTGKRPKTGNRLSNYGRQTTFYATAFGELTKESIDTVIIMQLLPDKFLWQESTPAVWLPSLQERIAQYATLINGAL